MLRYIGDNDDDDDDDGALSVGGRESGLEITATCTGLYGRSHSVGGRPPVQVLHMGQRSWLLALAWRARVQAGPWRPSCFSHRHRHFKSKPGVVGMLGGGGTPLLPRNKLVFGST